jgi:hypothetical protein
MQQTRQSPGLDTSTSKVKCTGDEQNLSMDVLDMPEEVVVLEVGHVFVWANEKAGCKSWTKVVSEFAQTDPRVSVGTWK